MAVAAAPFVDQLRQKMGQMPDKVTTVSLSPDAQNAVNQGSADGMATPAAPDPTAPDPNAAPATQPGGTQPAAPASSLGNDLRSAGFGSGNDVVTKTAPPSGPAVTPPPPAGSPPLLLHDPSTGQGYTNQQQAKIVTEFLARQGYPVQYLAAGGSSPVDGQIVALIDQINAPGASDAQQRALAQQMSVLITERNKVVTNPEFYWNTKTGQAEPVSTDGSRTTGQLVGSLVPATNGGQAPQIPGVTTDPITPTTPPVNTELYNQLLKLFASGGVDPQQQQLQQDQLVSSVEGAAQGQKQRLADELAARGQFGGSGLDMLNQIDNQALNARAQGLATIQGNVLAQQVQARGTALETILRQMGMGSQEAASLAANLTQRSIAQAQLATNNDQFQQNYALNQQQVLGNQQLGAQQLAETSRNNSMDTVLALLNMSNTADAQTRSAIEYLLNQFMTGGTL